MIRRLWFSSRLDGVLCPFFTRIRWTDKDEASLDPAVEDGESNRTDSEGNVSSDQAVSRSEKKCVSSLLLRNLPNHERQAVLAAKRLGEDVIDGNDAVRSGLAKRGVVKTYVMIEGCPKELGCTVILRGASRPALKQVKKVLRFMINAVSRVRPNDWHCYFLHGGCRRSSVFITSQSWTV